MATVWSFQGALAAAEGGEPRAPVACTLAHATAEIRRTAAAAAKHVRVTPMDLRVLLYDKSSMRAIHIPAEHDGGAVAQVWHTRDPAYIAASIPSWAERGRGVPVSLVQSDDAQRVVWCRNHSLSVRDTDAVRTLLMQLPALLADAPPRGKSGTAHVYYKRPAGQAHRDTNVNAVRAIVGALRNEQPLEIACFSWNHSHPGGSFAEWPTPGEAAPLLDDRVWSACLAVCDPAWAAAQSRESEMVQDTLAATAAAAVVVAAKSVAAANHEGTHDAETDQEKAEAAPKVSKATEATPTVQTDKPAVAAHAHETETTVTAPAETETAQGAAPDPAEVDDAPAKATLDTADTDASSKAARDPAEVGDGSMPDPSEIDKIQSASLPTDELLDELQRGFSRLVSDAADRPAWCNICQKTLYKDRYKCISCPNWDACQACVAQAETVHPGHKLLLLADADSVPKDAYPTQWVAHVGVDCDVCQKEIIGPRYKCTLCEDYDLCTSCEASPLQAHHHQDGKEHTFVKLDTPGDADAWERHASKHGAEVQPILDALSHAQALVPHAEAREMPTSGGDAARATLGVLGGLLGIGQAVLDNPVLQDLVPGLRIASLFASALQASDNGTPFVDMQKLADAIFHVLHHAQPGPSQDEHETAPCPDPVEEPAESEGAAPYYVPTVRTPHIEQAELSDDDWEHASHDLHDSQALQEAMEEALRSARP